MRQHERERRAGEAVDLGEPLDAQQALELLLQEPSGPERGHEAEGPDVRRDDQRQHQHDGPEAGPGRSVRVVSQAKGHPQQGGQGGDRDGQHEGLPEQVQGAPAEDEAQPLLAGPNARNAR